MPEIKLGNKIFYYQVFYKRNKNMYMRVKDNVITITTNKVPIKIVEDFILSHEEKILKLTKVRKKPLYNNENMLVFGKLYPVYVKTANKNSVRMNNDLIEIETREFEINNASIEKFYKKLTIMKINDLMPEIKQFLGKEISLENVTFKAQLMKSRFGSCIPKKRIIKLNSILARFDESFLKTILIHELIHLDVSGHQSDFYHYIDKYVPDYKIMIRRLQALTREFEV